MATALAGFGWSSVIGVLLVFAAVAYLVVWEIRRFAGKQPLPPQTFDLRELRDNLAETRTASPEAYETEVEPLLNSWAAKYGNNVPMSELEELRQLIPSKLVNLEERRQQIISQGAEQGKTIAIELLRLSLEGSKAAYSGAERNAYDLECGKLLESLTKKYGSQIPVDHAYKIMQSLEAGLGLPSEE